MSQNTVIDHMLNTPSLYGNQSYAEDICQGLEELIYDKVMSFDDDEAYNQFDASIENAKTIANYEEQCRKRLAVCASWAYTLNH